MQLVFLPHFLQYDSLWPLTTNEEVQIWMFEAKLWDNPTEEVDTLSQKEMLALMMLTHFQLVHFSLNSIHVDK